MRAEHQSQNLYYRNPYGACVCEAEVTLRIAIGESESVDAVFLVCETMHPQAKETVKMHLADRICSCYIYEVTVKAPKIPCLLFYSFSVESGGQTLYYGNNDAGLGGLGQWYDENPLPYQITVYSAGFETPRWFREGVMYQIFVDRFYKANSDKSFGGGRGDIIRRNWGEVPYYKAGQFGGKYLANDFFGGNLAGILEKLPYLHGLGVTVLYLSPVFQAYSNHKYDTGDYEFIDEMFGDNGLFEELCRTASDYGIRVILDGVFSHTGSDSKYFNKYGRYASLGAYQSKQSPYYDWYTFETYPDRYESWWGFDTLPNVNEKTPSYIKYILESPDAIIKRWLRAGASGWRLDVADELPDEFIKIMRREVKKTNPDAVLIGEVWEDASNKISYGIRREYLLGEELDTVMNYPLLKALLDFTCNHIDAQTFRAQIESLRENYPETVFYAMMNILGTHDTQRILTALAQVPRQDAMSLDEKACYRLSEEAYAAAKSRLQFITALQMTLPGVPCIYYGDEAGMQGFRDPFCRGCYPWGDEDPVILAWYHKIIALRNQSTALRTGRYHPVFADAHTFGYLRLAEDETILVIGNAHMVYDYYIELNLGRYGTGVMYDCLTREKVTLQDGVWKHYLQPGEIRVFRAGRSAACEIS